MIDNSIPWIEVAALVVSAIIIAVREVPGVCRGGPDRPRWGMGRKGPPVSLVGIGCVAGSAVSAIITMILVGWIQPQWDAQTYEIAGTVFAAVFIFGVAFDYFAAVVRRLKHRANQV